MRPEHQKFSLLPGIYRISITDIISGKFVRGSRRQKSIINRILVKAESEESAIQIAKTWYKGKGEIDSSSIDTFSDVALKIFGVYTKEGYKSLPAEEVIDIEEAEQIKSSEREKEANQKRQQSKTLSGGDPERILNLKINRARLSGKLPGTVDPKNLTPEQQTIIDNVWNEYQQKQRQKIESVDILDKIDNLLK